MDVKRLRSTNATKAKGRSSGPALAVVQRCVAGSGSGFLGVVGIEDFGSSFSYGARIAYHFTEDVFA